MNKLHHKSKFRHGMARLILLFACIMLGFNTMDDPRVNKIMNQLNLFTTRSKLQKVYLKTNKDIFMAGETIWLNAYVVDAISFLPDTSSHEIYVDLLGRNNQISSSLILENKNGISQGDILLTDSLPEGNYQLVAYTNWMKNFSSQFFFTRTIQIRNPSYQKYLTNNGLNEIKKYNRDLEKAKSNRVIQFFPEGGNMINGIESRIAFKAINELGLGVDVYGEIFDDTGNKVSKFESKHLGMGSFLLTPEMGRKYFAKATFASGETKKFDLPQSQPEGYTIMANALAGDQIRISIQSNVNFQAGNKSSEIIIAAQSRNELRYMSKAVLKGKPVLVSIPKKTFPPGITQITIFDGNGDPVCERLVFIHPKESGNQTKVEVISTNSGDEITCRINLKKADGSPNAGKISLAVSENQTSLNGWDDNIVSNLLLTSDLTGKIENASGYFMENNPEATMEVDYVMMVNGWRRFIWKEILAGQFQSLIFAPSEGVQKNEIQTSPMQALQYQLGSKAFEEMLNENYDNKVIRRNTNSDSRNNSPSENVNSGEKQLNEKNASSYSNMIQYLKGRVAGVTVSDQGIVIRGSASFMAGTDPLILQDDSPITFSDLKSVSPLDVKSVEVLKGSDASIYGVRGANGVIILHMKTGKELLDKITAENKENAKPVRIISFSRPREFYVPAYDSWQQKPQDLNIPRSIYWKSQIEIDSTGTTIIKFKNKSEIKNYITSLEGISKDGSLLFFSEVK